MFSNPEKGKKKTMEGEGVTHTAIERRKRSTQAPMPRHQFGRLITKRGGRGKRREREALAKWEG